MKIGFLKDSEPRVSITPSTLEKYIALNHDIFIEKNAGIQSGFSDNDYVNAELSSRNNIYNKCDIIVSVNSSSIVSFSELKNKSIISNFSMNPDKQNLSKELTKNNITAYDLSMIPRTTIAQSMDILSSMAGLSGYKSIIKAAELIPKIFPMTITAAGSIKPVKVVVLGAGVAGLQAIATAKRLGAIVEASDPRQAAKEEVLSLGAKFIEVEGAVEDESAGGYAVKQSKEYLEKQKEEVTKRLIEADVVVTTAQVFGSKSPILISKDIVNKMKPGSVIIDLASSTGGNCELTKDSKIVVQNGVKILGNSYLASELSHDASNLFSNNVFNFISYIIKDDNLIDEKDDILKSCKI
ncbi:MAG: NAD(P)(+) transhydrogenase (Re/Si-specific) subunit alpha [Cytophagia bacterium]|nr:NAD(P)(+) transhydrogenase (Re/Si-specific) subunit alpha [Cytophagia bacterium]